MRISISVPDELYQRMQRYKKHLNWSKVFQVAITKEVDKVVSLELLKEAEADLIHSALKEVQETNKKDW